MLDLIHRLDAGIQQEQANRQADPDRYTGKEALHPLLCRAGPDRLRSNGFFMDSNWRFRELLGEINLFKSGKNRIVERLIGLKLSLQIIVFHRLGCHIQKALFGLLAGQG